MVYNNYNLYIISDFEIRTVHEDQWDADLLVPVNNRTLNFSSALEGQGLFDTLQFPRVYGLMIRIAKSADNNRAAFHVLKNIDLNSAIANFDLDYCNLIFRVEEHDLHCSIRIFSKEE